MRHGGLASCGVCAAALLAAAGVARAQPAPASAPPPAAASASEVVVTADRAGLLERRPSATVFGLSKPLIETPRSATFVGDTTIERYGIRTIDDLVEIAPSAYTASFYGVPGSLNVRGTLAEDYFKGFKRVENRGTYVTPIADASELQVVRGPPNPIFGPGKVGGLLNFIPKTARDTGAYITTPTGELSLTGGDYDKKEITGQGGAPVDLGAVRGGVYGYVDVDDEHSYDHGIYPKRQTAELSADFSLPYGFTTSLQAMVYHSDGDVQTPGWNRITQALVDHGTYVTGRNTSIVDANGDGRIEKDEPGAYASGGAYADLNCFYYGCTNPLHQLTSGVGTGHLSTRTVFEGPDDFSHTTTYTVYANLAHPLGDGGAVKLEQFYDALSNEHFVSYGFPASYQTYVNEDRLTYSFRRAFLDGRVKTESFVGASYRYTDAHLRESFNSGIIALDRRDLVDGASPGDVIASPFQTDPSTGQQAFPWELDVHSNIRNAGAFVQTDITILDRLDILAGGREDNYDVSSNDLGVLSFESATRAHGDKGKGTYDLSVSYKAPLGLIPYYTYDQAAALEIDQAGDLQPTTIAQGGYVSSSYLSEAGLKFQELDNTLVGSLAFYRQTRTEFVQGMGAASIQGTRSKGVEFELRWVATRNLSLTYAGDIQHTEVKGPDGTFVYIPPSADGVAGVDGYGGSYAASIDALPGRGGDYAYLIIPHAVNSLYATFTSDRCDWGRVGATWGGTHVSRTAMLIQDPVVYPDYWLSNLSGFYQYGRYTVLANIDNLFDARYFTPNADPTYANVAALPGVGREWRLTVKARF